MKRHFKLENTDTNIALKMKSYCAACQMSTEMPKRLSALICGPCRLCLNTYTTTGVAVTNMTYLIERSNVRVSRRLQLYRMVHVDRVL